MAERQLSAKLNHDRSGYEYLYAHGPMTLGELRQALPEAWARLCHASDSVYNIDQAVREELNPAIFVRSIFRHGGAVTQQGVFGTRPLTEIIADMPKAWQEELQVYGALSRRLSEYAENGVRLGLASADPAESATIIDPSFINNIGYRITSGKGVAFGYKEDKARQIIEYERARNTSLRRYSSDFAHIPFAIEAVTRNIITEKRKQTSRLHPYIPVADRAIARASLISMVGRM